MDLSFKVTCQRLDLEGHEFYFAVMASCSTCGTKVLPTAKFCLECGLRLDNQNKIDSDVVLENQNLNLSTDTAHANQTNNKVSRGLRKILVVLGIFIALTAAGSIFVLVSKSATIDTSLNLTNSETTNKSNLHTVTLIQEVWGPCTTIPCGYGSGYFSTTPDGRCEVGVSPLKQIYNLGLNVVLIGPSEEEIAATSFSYGTTQPSVADLTEISFNPPNGDVCSFTAVFTDVPEVATYRIKTADGDSSGGSTSLKDLKANDWEILQILHD